MPTGAVTPAFVVVFGAFVVATVVLIVLVLRFTLRRAAASRRSWIQGDDDSEGDRGDDRPLTALVLGGGGTRGAAQIGMLEVLAEHGFVPDLVFGCSVGAINGVGYASDPTPEGVERMATVWRGLGRLDIYPQGRLHGPWMYLQQRDAVYANSGLRAVIEAGIVHPRLEQTPVPVEVVATSLTDGAERWFTSGPAVDAVLASTAMPAIFPPVEIDGDRCIDGGVVDNVPIQRAIDAGATRIVVLLCSAPTYTPPPPRRPVETMVAALLIATHARFVRDMARIPPGVEVILCIGDDGAARDFDDFSATEELIARGRREALDVVRRYGLAGDGRVPPPRPALPGSGPSAPEEPSTTPPVGSPTSAPDVDAPSAAGADGATSSERAAAPSRSEDAGPGPVTQPVPGT
jgi:NTE family protein